jgi:hypothetical protein
MHHKHASSRIASSGAAWYSSRSLRASLGFSHQFGLRTFFAAILSLPISLIQPFAQPSLRRVTHTARPIIDATHRPHSGRTATIMARAAS